MAVTGTGTQADPYVVTTYAELVEKAAESGKYVKIGNDINITDEYPNGDMPMLVVRAEIDGDGKTISNWYRTTSNTIYAIQFTNKDYGSIKNLNIFNIYIKSSIYFMRSDPRYRTEALLTNCNVSGIMANNHAFYSCAWGTAVVFRGCSFNLKCSKFMDTGEEVGFASCYLKIQTTASYILRSSDSSIYSDSYIEAVAPNLTSVSSGSKFSNSVLDITSNASFSVTSTSEVSIVNSTHAPNVTVSGNAVAVTDENWLDVSYLSSIGFNAG